MIALPVIALLLAGPAPAAPLSVRWEASHAAAVSKAKAAGKPLMIDFWADWCGYCHELDRTTYRDPAVARATREFVAVKVNAEGPRPEALVTARYLVDALPTILFTSPNGRPFLRLDGYLAPERFLQALAEAKRLGAPVLAMEAALAKDPNDVEALVELGQHEFHELARMAQRNSHHRVAKFLFEDSDELLTRACRVDGDRPPAERKRLRTNLGLLNGTAGKFPEALAALKEALAIAPPGPDDARTYSALGEVYSLQGDQKLARETFRKLVQTYPQSDEAQLAKRYLADLPE